MIQALLHAIASQPTVGAGDIHTVIDGLIVASLFAILVVGIKMLRGQRRTHEALWGFKEGERVEPGVVDIIRGNGHGSLLDVSEAALSASKAASEQAVANGVALAEHVIEDNRRWDEIQRGIAGLANGQASAAQTAANVSAELHSGASG